MTIEGKWFLDDPLTEDGEMIEGWHFTMGIPYTGKPPIACNQYQKGIEIPVAFGGLDAPYLRKDIAQVILNIDPLGVEVFPVAVEDAESEYWIVNALRVLDAIHPSSNIEHYSEEDMKEDPDRRLRYKSVWDLILDTSKIDLNTHIFRLKYSLGRFYVSHTIKESIESVCPNHGGEFTEIKTV